MCGVGMLAGSLLVRNFRLLNQNLVDSCHRSRSPLEEINHPSQCNYRPGKLHHVCEECDVAAQFHVAEEHLARSQPRSEEHTSELQSHSDLVCRLLLEKKKKKKQ